MQIKELKYENDINQRLNNQDIKKEIKDYEAEIIRLNKIINGNDEELTQIRKKLDNQESEIDWSGQQIKFLQQQNDDSKKAHKWRSQKVIKHYSIILKKFSD